MYGVEVSTESAIVMVHCSTIVENINLLKEAVYATLPSNIDVFFLQGPEKYPDRSFGTWRIHKPHASKLSKSICLLISQKQWK